MSGAASFDALFVELQLALAGRYSLDRELGRGGMGVVYLARDVQLDRPVAIKVLPPERGYDDEVRARFVREARLAAKLSHPNIVPIHAVDEVGPFVFYVMTFVDGETLGERVRARGPMPAAEATRVLREVAWALGHAHAQGVVHRDVKPENILLERGTGRALVTDFGIAAAIGSDDDGPVTGTPEYMSPEQALGHPVDARSDIYALGAMAFFVSTGRPPFTGGRAVDVLAHQVATPAPPVVASGTRVPRRLAHLIEKCLAKAPAERPQSALALAEQLGAAVEERREVPAALRAFVKRDGRVLSAGGVLLVGYFGLMGLVSVGLTAGPLVAVATGAAIALTPVAAMVWAARKLLRRGYELPDLRVAFEHDIEQLREEFHATGLREARGVERAATVVALASGVGFVVVTVLYRALLFSGSSRVLALAAPLLGVGAVGGFLVRAAVRHRRPYAASEGWA
ncbi:MAG: serine/threonine protein kinase, partial [Gemmatimonadaceae bacterium]|nr:serine/threonine protein kinase [Gemmatimonadaceae bacterium]